MARKQLFGCMVALSRNGVYIRFGHHLFGSILSIDRCISLFLWYIHTSAKRGLPDRPVHVLVFTRFGETCVVRSTCYTFRRTVCGLMDLIHVSARRVYHMLHVSAKRVLPDRSVNVLMFWYVHISAKRVLPDLAATRFGEACVN